MNRDQLRAIAQPALELAQKKAPPTLASVFGVIENGDISQMWYLPSGFAVQKKGEAFVNAEDIPGGPAAGQAIYLGTVMSDDGSPLR